MRDLLVYWTMFQPTEPYQAGPSYILLCLTIICMLDVTYVYCKTPKTNKIYYSPGWMAQLVVPFTKGCSSIPGQGRYLDCGFHSQGTYRKQLIDISVSYQSLCVGVCVSLSYPPRSVFLSLKSINISSDED